jgi:hypothetical protein
VPGGDSPRVTSCPRKAQRQPGGMRTRGLSPSVHKFDYEHI